MKRHARVFAVLVCFLPGTFGLFAPITGAAAAERSVETLFIDAQKALARGDSEGAEALLADALARDPSFVSAIWQLAQIHESHGRLERARELLARGLAIDPKAAWARERLDALEARLAARLLAEARGRLAEGNYRLASARLSAYLDMRPSDAAAIVAIARCELALGDTERAAGRLDRARSIDPANPEISRLGVEIEKHRQAERVERLVRDAKRALAAAEPDGEDMARETLRRIVAADPGHSWAIEELRLLDERETAGARTSPPPPALRIEEAGTDSSREAIPPPAPPERSPAPRRGRSSLWFVFPALAVACGVLAAVFRRRSAVERYPLEGSISLIPMLDLVTLVSGNRRTGILAIEGDAASGEIYFASGEVAHARCNDLAGRKAFHRLMELRSGRFRFHNHLPTTRRTITEPLSTLLLSIKSRDETQLSPARRPPARETSDTTR